MTGNAKESVAPQAESDRKTALCTAGSVMLASLFAGKAIRTAGTMRDPLFCLIDVGAHVNDAESRIRLKATDMVETKNNTQIIQVTEDGEIRPRLFFSENGVYIFLLGVGTKPALDLQKFIFGTLKEERNWATDQLVPTQKKRTQLLYEHVVTENRRIQQATKEASETHYLQRLRKQEPVVVHSVDKTENDRFDEYDDQDLYEKFVGASTDWDEAI